MPEVICFGEALIDFLAEPAGGRGGGPRHFVQYAGGAPANVAVAVARLGGAAAFVGMLGEDMFGDFLVHSFDAAGVATDRIVRTGDAKTALAFVSLDQNGERHFSFYRPPAADLLFRPEHFRENGFASAAVFHVCSNSLTEAAIADTTFAGMERARRAGALVSVDLNLRPSLWPKDVDPRPRLWSELQRADLVKLDRAELAFLAGPAGGESAALAAIRQGRTRFVVVTDGPAPVRYWTPAAAGEVATFPIAAIDTTAAGDAFVGGLLYRLASGGVDAEHFDAFVADEARVREALAFASACGALATTRHGAFAAMPGLPDVLALLARRRA